MEHNLSDDLLKFVVTCPREEIVIDDPPVSTIEESILTQHLVEEQTFKDQVQDDVLIVEVPLPNKDARKIDHISPILGDVEHIDFIFGDLLDAHDDGPKFMNFNLTSGLKSFIPPT